MENEHPVELSSHEIEGFLGSGGTGVLSLADGDRPYAIPVSYGFDVDRDRFFFRLGLGETGEKRRFLAGRGNARLVVYDESEGNWTSVIASGRLSAVDDEALTGEIATLLGRAAPPLIEIWTDDPDDVTVQLYRLDIDDLTGRTTAQNR